MNDDDTKDFGASLRLIGPVLLIIVGVVAIFFGLVLG
jgi:hypothetical protein